jgi:predicted aconitase
MYLTREEEKILQGDYGEGKRIAMELVVRVGEALGAERLIEINHAHASGISYDNIGDAGLEFIKSLFTAGARVSVYSTYNPVGISLNVDPPPRLNVGEDFAKKQMDIIRLLNSMGFVPSVTCIPYYMRQPRLGEHLAWGESSAIAVANSLYGARTNREGGPLALAAAIVGRTYYWGLHIDENRKPTIHVKVNVDVSEEPSAGLLGYYIGQNFSDTIPYVDLNKGLGKREAISMCAAAAASGNIAMCIVKNVSPEDEGPPLGVEKVHVDQKELEYVREDIESASIEEAEIFFTGCPHHEPSIVYKLFDYLSSKNIKRLRREIWISIPGYASSDEKIRELAQLLQKKNVYILPGTCIVVARLRGKVGVIATDSLKTAFYVPKRHGVRVAITSLWDFVKRFAE